MKLYESVLNAHISGEKIPDYQLNSIGDISRGWCNAPKDLEKRAKESLIKLCELEWKICKEAYPEADELKKKTGQGSPFAMFLIAYNKKYIGDEVQIIMWGNPNYLIIIKNKNISDSFRKQFELMWKIAKK